MNGEIKPEQIVLLSRQKVLALGTVFRYYSYMAAAIAEGETGETKMNEAQAKIIGKLVTESVLDFLASKHNTTANVIADLVALGHANVSKQFYELIGIGLKEAFLQYATF